MFGLLPSPAPFPSHFPSSRGEGLSAISHQCCLQSNTCPQLLGPETAGTFWIGDGWLALLSVEYEPWLPQWEWFRTVTFSFLWSRQLFVLGNGPYSQWAWAQSQLVCEPVHRRIWAQSSSHREKISDWNKRRNVCRVTFYVANEQVAE